jgi:hypothetical protein
MAIWCEGVFRRDKGVLRRALKVVRQAGPRKVADALDMPMLAGALERVDLIIGDPEGGAEVVRTGEAFGVDPSGALPAGF